MDSLVVKAIIAIAEKYIGILKVWLFGSRARGDNHEKSDYDIAIFAPKLSESDKLRFLEDIEKIETFHKIDIVFMKENTVLRDGAIQRFELTAELSWKTVREYLLTLQINDINNPRAVMAEAYNNNLINSEEN